MEKNLSLRPVVLLAVWSLAACGSDGTTSSTESSNDTAATTTFAEVASTAEVVDGFTFTPPAGDYSVVFPAEPTTNEQTFPLPDGSKVPVTFYLADSEGMQFGTAAIVYPQGTVLSLEGARDGAISNISGTLTSSEPITLQGREGIQFTASVQNGQVTYLERGYADDVSLYQVIAVVIGEVAFDDPQIAAFFDSFRFTADL